MKVLYFVASGASDATRALVPLHLAANGGLEAGQEVVVVLGGDGAELILEDNHENLTGVGVPSAKDLWAKLREHEVPVHV